MESAHPPVGIQQVALSNRAGGVVTQAGCRSPPPLLTMGGADVGPSREGWRCPHRGAAPMQTPFT